MTTLKLRYSYSAKYRSEKFIETGERPLSGIQKIEPEGQNLTKEARIAHEVLPKDYNDAINLGEFDGDPTWDQISDRLVEMMQAKRVEEQEKAAAKAEKNRIAAERLAVLESMTDAELIEWEDGDCYDIFRNTDYYEAYSDISQKQFQLRKRHEEAEKQRKIKEKVDWISVNGSDHLKKAYAAGYDCQRKYVQERAAIEFPGFAIDFDDNAEWTSRSCPSMAALEEAEKHKDADAEIVWITQRHDYDPEDYETPAGEEAVVIREYLGKYDLILYMGDPEA